MTFEIAGLDGLRAFAGRLASALSPGQIYLLQGELGAGKTALVRAVCASLGVPPGRVVSPTFTLVQEYEGGRMPVVHVDLYRIDAGRPLASLFLEELLERPGAVAFIEWPGVAQPLLPEGQARTIRIGFGAEEGARIIATDFDV